MAAEDLWIDWCGKNDGGEGHSQFTKNGKDLNTDLFMLVKKVKGGRIKGKGRDDPETVYETWWLLNPLATFSMEKVRVESGAKQG